MASDYIVTVCYDSRVHDRDYASLIEVKEALAKFFSDEKAVSFVVTRKDSPWRKNMRGEEE